MQIIFPEFLIFWVEKADLEKQASLSQDPQLLAGGLTSQAPLAAESWGPETPPSFPQSVEMG